MALSGSAQRSLPRSGLVQHMFRDTNSLCEAAYQFFINDYTFCCGSNPEDRGRSIPRQLHPREGDVAWDRPLGLSCANGRHSLPFESVGDRVIESCG
jgi:hypothetical protein